MPPRAPAPRLSAPAPAVARLPTKQFSVAPWTGAQEGKKVLIYAPPKMGKTTLASMAPDPVFIGSDDGGRLVRHPHTGQPVLYVPGIETFNDLRAVLQSDIFDPHKSVVFDTVTDIQRRWVEPWLLANIPTEKGQKVTNVEAYGWGKGYRHVYDTMHFILSDCERLVRQGKNIIFLCQAAVMKETTGTEDYVKDGPDLQHNNQWSTRGAYLAWVDHIFRINWENASVEKKKITPTTSRVINVHADATFHGGSRTLPADCANVTFTDPKDDSIWQLLFGGE